MSLDLFMKKSLKTIQRPPLKDTIYLHESECFYCQKQTTKDGGLNNCDFCTRAYHPSCGQMQLNQNQQKICPCCQSNRKCQFCQHIPEASDMVLFCTLCYLPVHHNCYLLVKGRSQPILTQEEMEDVVFGSQAYVCKDCLFRNGILKIKKVRRYRTIKNFEIEEKMVGLVLIRSRSPVHCGWFCQSDIRQAFSQQKLCPFYSKKYKQIRYFHPRLLNRRAAIEKILAIRPESQFEQVNFLDVLNNVRNSQRRSTLRFGTIGNYKFLVKWQPFQYDCATWEDQFTISLLDPTYSAVIKYLYSFLTDHGSGKYDFLSNSSKLLLLSQDSQSSSDILKMAKFRWKYPIEIVINQKQTDIFVYICKYINQIYILQRQKFPTVILVHEAKLDMWQQALISTSNYVNMVCLRGSVKSCNMIRSIEFAHRRGKHGFDVLLLSYQMYKSERQRDYILRYLNHAAVYICTDFQNPSFITNFYHKGIADHFIYIVNRVVNNRSIERQLVKNICSYFQKNLIIKHTANWTEFEIMTTKRHVEDGRTTSIQIRQGESQIAKAVKKQPFPQLKRLSFLNYILQFGIELSQLNELHEKMLDSCKEIYDVKSQQSKQHFKSYIRGFFSILTHYNEVSISQDILSYYLFDLNPNDVIKRVMQLSRLKEVLSINYYDFNICSMEDQNAESKAPNLKNWNNTDDITLAHLILKEGFGNWQKIASNIDWNCTLANNKESKAAFEMYVKIKAIASGIKKISVVDFIASRSDLILQRMSRGL